MPRIRRSYHITNDCCIREMQEPDRVALIVGDSTAFLTEELWKALCDLRYTIHFTPEQRYNINREPPEQDDGVDMDFGV